MESHFCKVRLLVVEIQIKHYLLWQLVQSDSMFENIMPSSFPLHRDDFRREIHFILKEDLWNLFVSLYTMCPEGDDLTGHVKSFGSNTDDSTMPWTRYSASMRGNPLVFPERRTGGNGSVQHRFQWVCVSSLSSLSSRS